MNPNTKSSWWHNATTEQRLAQIDGGIECGMTLAQVAMASRANVNTVSSFATFHRRSFFKAGVREMHRKMSGTTWAVRRNRAAFLSGEPIDLWGNTEAQEEFLDEREGA